ncbi:ABC-F family ATP-binding cassette domain-containing protein [Bacillus paralicheniformis]|uniref:ABC-F family ATP-binding cassette domain-containing protein n=1 Tax=Bacillus paralicheniformis TaxID=1648923 RepID=UPI002243E5F1|nr:ABC-F family ATP-binding cassette domain-containing protein [Bacillus paralicheniformis]MEC1023177.1 ABC-F family ATP-binding cassette domain-containing protein [Bacillus paralicheniformis]MEC1025743.1 ABC-F family ATP-binding cassette domain-containing protein [Bacillus paralicheniformis]MEC1035841.1 ABC-F family ATP-binding cassette domain-containing protein [Bacillus paralicheniformis]MEC1050021.1 ABC-F family ATP-binding cassette domain-containing protein [Bacillus paralicheniformis]MEC
MSIFKAKGLYKTYGDKTLFDHISFHIEENERIGLIGPNGTGKSSLLKVIAGFESAEKGEITKPGTLQIEYLDQDPDLDGSETVLEHIYSGDSVMMRVLRTYEKALQELNASPADPKKQENLLGAQAKMDAHDAWDANTAAKTILTKLGVADVTKEVRHLSGGQKKRVAIAKTLIQPADLLILDEPTNHLDNETIEWLEGYLSGYPGSVVLVTHDRYFLNRVTNRIYELDRGHLYTYKGNYEVFLEKRAEREALAEQNETKRQNLLRRELAWLRRGAKARSTKQKARIQRVEELKEQDAPESGSTLDFAIGSHRLGKQVIEAETVEISRGGKQLVTSFDELIIPGDRIGIIGPNGIGKTTLLNALAGRVEPDAGRITIGQTVRIGYYTQDHSEMDDSLHVIEYIKETAEIVKTADGQVITAEQMLERFLFPRRVQRNFIHKLSGGEKRRLYLLKVLMEEPNVLFLDEPTNDLDTETLGVLEDYLEQFPGVVVTVSHDRYFLDRVIDRLLVFEGNGAVSRFHGSYSEYMEKQKDIGRQKVSQETTEPVKPEKKKRKKLSYKDQLEWDGIEDRIAALEEKHKRLEEEIAAAGSDFAKIQTLMEEQNKTAEELEEAMERWTELSLMIEELEQS